jgi:hypothetical protein
MRNAAAKGTKNGDPIGRPRLMTRRKGQSSGFSRGGTGINKTAATVGDGGGGLVVDE